MGYKQDVLNSQKELMLISKNKREIIVKAKYGPSKPTKIPLSLNKELSFFVATIIGDGHLKKNKLQISIEVQNKKLIEELIEICKSNFNRKFEIHNRNKLGKEYYSFFIDSKAIYNLLNKTFSIPFGKKSHIVTVPEYVKYSSKKIKLAFLQGIMVTEGGKRKRGFGLSTASEQLWKDLIILFKEVGINTNKDKWIYKKYKKEYYGISFRKEYMKLLMRSCRSGQTGEA